MKKWFERVSIPLISMTLPYFAAELFLLFFLLTIWNNPEDIPNLFR